MIGLRMLLLFSFAVLAGCAKPEVEAPIAVWESSTDAAGHVRLTLYRTKSAIEYGGIHIEVVTKIRGDALFWISEPDHEGRPQAGTEEVQFAAIQKNRDLVIRFVPALADDSKLAPYVLHKKPNQALEPTTLLVTPRADARVAPSRVVAHL
jgi:hypothetical protein